MNKTNFFKKIAILLIVLLVTLLIPHNEVNAFTLTKEPTCVAMTYYDDIDSRGFAWQTATSVTETHLLVVKDEGQTVNWRNVVPILGSYTDFYDYRCHKAQVTDLEAGKYLYRVGGNGVYSEVGTFTVDDSTDG